MDVRVTVDIAAPPDKVWAVMTDVERWHEWTDSITGIQYLDGAGMRQGGRVRIRQPKLPPVVWRISAVEPGRYFEWRNSAPGTSSVAGHRIEPTPTGSRVTLSMRQSGPLGSLMGMVFENRITRPYMHKEAQGLKRRCEVEASA